MTKILTWNLRWCHSGLESDHLIRANLKLNSFLFITCRFWDGRFYVATFYERSTKYFIRVLDNFHVGEEAME